MDGVNFSQALSIWKDVQLAELQKTLDAQGLEIVENQKENVVGRKKLAEATRDFKRISDEEKLTAFKTLLKSYQAEIDALTRRSKVAENAFLNVYKVLAEAPDPFPLLDAAVDSTAKASEARLLEAELAREREENSALKVQVNEAQLLEKERKRLADKCDKYEAKLEDMINEKVAAKEAEINAIYDERLRNYDEREKDLAKQVSLARDQLKELRTSNESTHARLFDHSSRQDQETVSRHAEIDLLSADLARANGRIADMERRNEKLRAEIAAVRAGSESSSKIQALETQISDLQAETSRLLHSIDAQNSELQHQRAAVQKREGEQEDLASVQSQEIAALRKKLEEYSDYDEIKRELDIMKFIEFSGSVEDDADDEGSDSISAVESSLRLPNPNGDKSRGRGKPLENLLLSKNRKIQEQVTTLRVAHEELQAKNDEAQRQISLLQAELETQKKLNDRLENDLLRLNNNTQAPSSEASASTSKQDGLGSLGLGKRAVSAAPKSTVGSNVPTGLTSAAETSILPIITSQRDRFRQRNAELEEELRKQQSTIQEVRNEMKALQSDNVKLYEKVRYLQSYQNEGGAAGPSKSLYPPPAIGKDKDEQLGKYKSMYEQSMNPFEAFRGRERTSAVQALNPVEKVLLAFANLILGNRVMRLVFVGYAACLHIFVFGTLFEFSSSPQQHTTIDRVPGQ